MLDRHWERFRANPDDRSAFEALEESLFVGAQWENLISLYQRRLTAPSLEGVPAERARLLFRVGQISQEHTEDSGRAIDCLRSALGIDPTFRPALSELRRIHLDRHQWDIALQIAEAESALEMPLADRVELLAQVGSLWLDHLDDSEQALGAFEQVLQHDASHAAALAGSARALQTLGRARDAAGRWERYIPDSRGRERAAARVALAGLLAGPLGQNERAAGLYREALNEDPRNLAAAEALAALAAAGRQWTWLAELQERCFELSQDPAARAVIAREAGLLQLERIENPRTAKVWLVRAAELAPEDAEVFRALAECERAAGDDDALALYLEQMVALTATPPVSALLELASLHSDSGADERAVGHLERAFEIAPDDSLLIDALCDTLSRLGRDEELVDYLERRVTLAAADPATHASVLTELAAHHEDRRDDGQAALHAYQRAFEADPRAPGVAAALERLLRKAESWEPLRDFLQQAGPKGPPEQRSGFLCSLAGLLREHFDDVGAAARAYEEVLAIDPTCAAAHRGRQEIAVSSGEDLAIIEAYEREAAVSSDRSRIAFLHPELARLLEERGRPEAALGWAQRWAAAASGNLDALAICARLHEQLGNDAELVATLERIDPLLSGDEQAAHRRRIGAWHAARGRSEPAIAAYRSALEVAPGDLEALEALETQLEQAGRWEDLAGVQRDLSARVPEAQRIGCLEGLATLLLDRLGDVSGAIDTLSELAELDAAPPDVEERLAELLARAGRHEELAQRLDHRSRAHPAESPEALGLALRRARVLLEELSCFEEATEAYQELFARDPSSEEARQGLERSLRASGDIVALEEFLAEQMEFHPQEAARERFALERALLLEEALDDAQQAAEIYRQLLGSAELIANRERAAARLEALLERLGDWSGLREHLQDFLDRCASTEKAAVHERLARLCRDRLDDRDAAIEHLEAAAALTPRVIDLWQALARLYSEAERPSDLVRVLESELETGVEPERELALRSEVAQLSVSRLDDPSRALLHYERLLDLDPTHPAAAEFLVEHRERAGDPEGVLRILEGRVAGLDALPEHEAGNWAAQRVSLRLRIAQLLAGPLDDLEAAIASLEPALSESGAEAVVAEPLADLYERSGFGGGLVQLCRQVAAHASDSGERANWLSRLGRALRERGDFREAADAYRRVLGERGGDAAARAALRDLYQRMGEFEPLARLLEEELTHLAGPDEIPVRMELAQLLGTALSHPSEALLHLRRVLCIAPGHVAALDRGLALAAQLNLGDVVLEMLDEALEGPLAVTRRAALLLQRGRQLALDPERVRRAADDYEAALRLDPSLRDSRSDLCNLLHSAGDWRGVLDCLLVEARVASPEQRASLYQKASDLAWQRLSPDAALPWLERLRCERPDQDAVLARIAEVHRIAGRPRAALRMLDQRIGIAEDAIEKRTLHLERARILEEDLESPGRAARALEQARRLWPRDTELLRELDRLYRGLGRDLDRASVLEALITGSDEAERVSLLCEIATLYAGPLAQPERAATHLLQAVAGTRPNGAVRSGLLRELGDALRASGTADAWARCAEQELAALDPEAPVFDERRNQLHRELAACYEQQGRPDAALRHLRPLVETDVATLETPEEIEELLLRLLRVTGNPLELERRLAIHLERRPGSAESWLELARLRDEHLHATAAAADAYRHVLELEDDCLPALRGLRATAERLGDWATVVEMLERECSHPQSRAAELRATLQRRLGDLCWHELQSTTRARRAYSAALELDPEDLLALRSLERLLEAMEDWSGALELCEREAELLGENDPERRQAVWLRAGELARDLTSEPERSLRAYVNAAATAPLALERRAERAELHRQCNQMEAFVEVFADWCDDPAAQASCADHVRLASAFEELEQVELALSRVERALEIDAAFGPAWEVAARLREARGDACEASEAWTRAGELIEDGGAAERMLRAAELVSADDPERAWIVLRRAAACDPASAGVQAAMAKLATRRNAPEQAESAAAQALELWSAGSPPDAEQRIQIALVGAQAARDRCRPDAAARFYAAILELEPQHSDALAGAGETLAEAGDHAAAREALEARLASGNSYPERACHHTLLARCLEAAGEPESALEHCEAALRDDPGQDEAHERCVGLHRAAGRIDAGIAALERWAEKARDPSERAERLLRAGEWEQSEGGLEAAAERHLREALRADPRSARAAESLATLLWQAERADEALEVASRGLDAARDAHTRRNLSLIRARVLEKAGDRPEAAEAFARAAEADPRCLEGALAGARLLRSMGSWPEAAAALHAFAKAHPGDDPLGLAQVYHQLGRLRAGPLEDVDGAIDAYRRSVELDPDHGDARDALAQLLSHRPDGWQEALRHHRAALELDPMRSTALRTVLRIARERNRPRLVVNGLAILRALGIASSDEAEPAPATLSVPIARDGSLSDPLWEKLRQVAEASAQEIGRALEVADDSGVVSSEEPTAAFHAAALAAEAKLTAPALLPLPTAELGQTLTLVATIALESESLHASGRTLNALSSALGRRTRRRLRRILDDVSVEDIEAIDFVAWRAELRAVAAAQAVDAIGGDLRSALLALLSDGEDAAGDAFGENTDLTPLVSGCPEARALLSHAVQAWLAGF